MEFICSFDISISKEKVKSKETLEHLLKEAKESEPNKLLSSVFERYHTLNSPNQIASLILYLKEKVVHFSFSQFPSLTNAFFLSLY
jgi:hypothetical protein